MVSAGQLWLCYGPAPALTMANGRLRVFGSVKVTDISGFQIDRIMGDPGKAMDAAIERHIPNDRVFLGLIGDFPLRLTPERATMILNARKHGPLSPIIGHFPGKPSKSEAKQILNRRWIEARSQHLLFRNSRSTIKMPLKDGKRTVMLTVVSDRDLDHPQRNAI